MLNLLMSEWGEVFVDQVVASIMIFLDLAQRQSIPIKDNSFRLKPTNTSPNAEKQEKGTTVRTPLIQLEYPKMAHLAFIDNTG